MPDYEAGKIVTGYGLKQNPIAIAAVYDLPVNIDSRSLLRTFRQKRTCFDIDKSDEFKETFAKMHEALSNQIEANPEDTDNIGTDLNYMKIGNFDLNACKTASELIPDSEIKVVLAKISKESFSPNIRSQPNYYNYFEIILKNGRFKTQRAGHYDIDAEYLDSESFLSISEEQFISERSGMKAVACSFAEQNAALEPTVGEIRAKEMASIVDYDVDENYDPDLKIHINTDTNERERSL